MECTASLNIAELPVIVAAMILVIAINALPSRAATTTHLEPDLGFNYVERDVIGKDMYCKGARVFSCLVHLIASVTEDMNGLLMKEFTRVDYF
jgi:hypothetical protein